MFGERLKKERKNLGLNQTDFVDICGASKRTVVDWEKDKTSPKAQQLMAMGEHGFDVNYLLTGKRIQSTELASDEAFLLDSFRALNDEKKKMVLQFLVGGLESLQDKSIIQNSVVNSFNQK